MQSAGLNEPPWHVTERMNSRWLGSDSPYLPSEGPLNLKHVYEFDLIGYTIIRGFLSEDTVAEMNGLIDRHQGREPTGFRKFPFLHLSPIFLDLMSDNRIMSICKHWLGPWFRLDSVFGVQAGPADSHETAQSEDLHAGPYAEEGVFRYNWFNSRAHTGLLAFVYCLKTVSNGDGGLVLVPGSHKSNLPVSGQDVFRWILEGNLNERWVDNPALNPGDLLVFTEATVHGTRQWLPKDRGRRNLHYGYSPGFQAQVDYSWIAEITPMARNDRERDLLRPPYVIQRRDDVTNVGDNNWRSTVR